VSKRVLSVFVYGTFFNQSWWSVFLYVPYKFWSRPIMTNYQLNSKTHTLWLYIIHQWGGLSGYDTQNLTVDHSGQHAWRVPCSLDAEDLFCRFWKRVGVLYLLQKTKYLVPTKSTYFSVTIKSHFPCWPIYLSFLYSVYILLNLFSSWMQLKYCLPDIK
jgi:hypothetical protein